jgi:hypothetical protein
MATFNYKGHTYDLYIRPWRKKNKGRYEALKWITGLKCTWERISIEEYNEARANATQTNYKAKVKI